MTCEELEELSGAYILGALTEEEHDAAQAHLAQCPRCSQVIEDLQGTVNMLPLAAPPIEPSPAVKQRLLNTIQASQPANARAPRVLSPRRSWWTQALVAAALVLLLISGGLEAWNISLQHQLAQSAPIHYTLQGNAVHGEITYLPQQAITILTLRDAPPLQGTQVYQGWGLHGKQPQSIGLFQVVQGVATLSFQGDARTFDALAVSREPGPQASTEQPQGPIVAQGIPK